MNFADHANSQARDDPNSTLVIPEGERQNRSKWSDPNNPMFNGGLIGLVSGGHIDVASHRQAKRERRNERRERRFERRYGPRYGTEYASDAAYEGSSNPPAPHAPYGGSQQDADYFNRAPNGRRGQRSRDGRRGRKGGPIGVIKKVMQEDVLYLMIVPMPSEAELEEAREMLALEKAKK